MAGGRAVTRQGRFEHFSFGIPWEALANYSQAGRVGNLIFVSGQLSHELDGTFVGEGDTEVQCRKTFENLDRVLERFRVERIDIAQVDVFLVNLPANFAAVGSACRTYLGDHRPANDTHGVAALALSQQLVEVAATAVLPS